MSIHYYILPIIRNGTGVRYPKYFQGRGGDPIGIICHWSMKDYGNIDMAILCADISDADHISLSANSDVLSIPINIDSTLTVAARNKARTFLESYNIPGNWINTGMMYRYVLRIVTAFFLYMQRVCSILGYALVLPENWANLTMTQVPANIRDAMAQVASDMGYDYSWVVETTTVRQLLKGMADAWGDTPILFGLATL